MLITGVCPQKRRNSKLTHQTKPQVICLLSIPPSPLHPILAVQTPQKNRPHHTPPTTPRPLLDPARRSRDPTLPALLAEAEPHGKAHERSHQHPQAHRSEVRDPEGEEGVDFAARGRLRSRTARPWQSLRFPPGGDMCLSVCSPRMSDEGGGSVTAAHTSIVSGFDLGDREKNSTKRKCETKLSSSFG